MKEGVKMALCFKSIKHLNLQGCPEIFKFPQQKSVAPKNKIFQKITDLPVNYIHNNICKYCQYFHHGNFETSFI